MTKNRHSGGNSNFALKMFAAVTSLLLAASVITTSVCFATGKWQVAPKDDVEQIQPEEEAAGNGSMLVGESEGHGISLMSAKISAADYADYDISPMAESAIQLTATLQPQTATNKEVDWSIAFANNSSSWATGKTVTDYVTVTPTSDGALTANVECLQAFGEQIIITVTSRDEAHATGTCTVDYQQKYIGTSSSISFDTENNGGSGHNYTGSINTGVEGSVCTTNIPTYAQSGDNTNTTYSAKNPINFTPILSEVYTKEIADADVSYSYYVKLNPEFVTALQSSGGFSSEDLANDWEFIADAEGSLSDAIESGISSDIATTVLDYYYTLNNALRSAMAPNVYYFTNELSSFISTADDESYQSSYHFQVKVEAQVGDETFETVTSVRFSESSLKILVQNINISSNITF